jgi:hypothetical protein
MPPKLVTVNVPACPHCGAPGGPVDVPANRKGGFRQTADCARCGRRFYATLTKSGRWRVATEPPDGWERERRPEYPIIWTPWQQVIALTEPKVWGRPDPYVQTPCRCPVCDNLLVLLSWAREDVAGDEPPVGIVVLDTLQKRRMGTFARLDNRLRGEGYAAALLNCRRCKAETVYIIGGTRIVKRVALGGLLENFGTSMA